jgi:hypothetical protein
VEIVDDMTLDFMAHVTAQVRLDGTFITVAQSEPGYSTADKAYKALLIEAGLADGMVLLPSDEDRDFAARTMAWAREVFVARSSFQEKQREAALQGVNKVNYRILASLYAAYDKIANRKKPFGAPGDIISCRALLKGLRAQPLGSTLLKGLDATFENMDNGSTLVVEMPANLQQDAADELVLNDEYQGTFYVVSARDLSGVWYCRGTAVELVHITADAAMRVIGQRIPIPRVQRAMPTKAIASGVAPEPKKVRDISLTEDD